MNFCILCEVGDKFQCFSYLFFMFVENTFLKKDFLFPIELTLLLIDHICVVFFQSFLFCSFDVYVYLYSNTTLHCLNSKYLKQIVLAFQL